MKRSLRISCCLIAAVAATSDADIAEKSKSKLRDESTHIATGSVQAIFASKVEGKQFNSTSGVVEIIVDELEKGEGIKSGSAVYPRFLTRYWNKKGPRPAPFGAGHILPQKGDLVRVYLKQQDGGFNVVLPNGFEIVKRVQQAKPAVAKATATEDLKGTWSFVYYEERGVVEEPGTKQFVIAQNNLDFRAGGETRVKTTIDVDATQDPKQLTQKFKDGQVYRSIYKKVGEYIIICGNRDKDRPSEFASGVDKGGEFLIVLKRGS